MKKFALTILVAFAVITVTNAQELKSKDGVPIAAEAGDYAIGIDATPIFNFFGNLIKINSGAAFADPAAWNFVDPTNNAIYGKYFVDANTAYRCNLRLGMTSTSTKNYVTQDGQADPLVTVEDKQKVSARNIIIGAGLEKHRGKGRLHGIYGAEFQIMLIGGKTKYTYGNAFSSTNTTPNTTNFTTMTTSGVGSRTTIDKTGGTLGIGVRPFVGVEYYILPKISVGGEFGWGLGFASKGDGEVTTEAWDGTTIKTTTAKTGGGGYLGFDNDNFSGCINMTFYF